MMSVTNCFLGLTCGIPLSAYIHSRWDCTVLEVMEDSDAPSHTLYPEIKAIIVVTLTC